MLLITPDGDHLSLEDIASQAQSIIEGFKDRYDNQEVLLLQA
jgi:hypothetical protein